MAPSSVSRATQVTSGLAKTAGMLPLQIRSGRTSFTNDSWHQVWVSSDAYSKTFTNVKLLLPMHGTEHPSVVEEWLRFAKTEDRFEAPSLGFVMDTWPQIVDAFGSGSPYSANGLLELANTAAHSGSNEARSADSSWDNGITIDQDIVDQWVKYWYPTLTMNLEVQRRLPEGGAEWLYQKVRATGIEKSKVNLQVAIADMDGSLIAVGNLSAMVVPRTHNARAHRL